MKKKLLVITAALIFTVSATFANDPNPVPATIINELHQEFETASNIVWKTTASFYKASFTTNTQSLEAFFSYDGRLIGVSRKLRIDQLPLVLIKEASEKGAAAEITDLFELSSDRGTEYFLTYGSGKEQKTFKSTGSSWSRYHADTNNAGI